MNHNNSTRASWSIFPGNPSKHPVLTSLHCYNALTNFFHNGSSKLLAAATEASSHPAGLDSLYAQPWVYAGGGLGNMKECPMQVCLAGGTKRDSLTFASVCTVPECDASDLAAPDFPGHLELASKLMNNSYNKDIIREYVGLHERIAEVNKFLQTGWVCGEYKVSWQTIPSATYLAFLFAMFAFSLLGTFCWKYNRKNRSEECANILRSTSNGIEPNRSSKRLGIPCTAIIFEPMRALFGSTAIERFWGAWDMSAHMKKLTLQRPETACLDGLKVGSILWVIFGHVMAIQSSTGAGYLNPSDFLPPVGITTTLVGQLLFSSRFAVDTFLCVSGFLVVHVLKRKLSPTSSKGEIWTLLAFRVVRILPLYAMCMAFWILIAPHLGSGPFWYQWESFLEPCRKYWWTNVLFLNNFIPLGVPTTDTCFYHSWYLAVDIQLFFLFAPWLVICFRKSETAARRITAILWAFSVVLTAVLAHVRGWSINTFDGMAVALFDIEGYAKPHVRAQSYLAGMYVAMLPRVQRRKPTWDFLLMAISVLLLGILSFATVTGAYAQRACGFEEVPMVNHCGSEWSLTETFLYTSFSRALWSICVGVIIALCCDGRGHAVEAVLGWHVWTPLSHLSFGVYLIHPIVIFVWQLSGWEKTSFSLFALLMDYTSVIVVSFTISFVASLTIELPVSELVQIACHRKFGQNTRVETSPSTVESVPLFRHEAYYGVKRDSDGEM